MSAEQAHYLVTSFGDAVDAVIVRKSTTPDPLDPNNQIETLAVHAATVAPNSLRLREIDGTTIKATDRVLSISPQGLAITPAANDEVIEGYTAATYAAANPKPRGLRVQVVMGTEWPYDVVLR